VYGYFKDWDGKTGYKNLPKLYAELDDASADAIQSLDDEIQAIKKEITRRYPQIDMSPLHPIKKRISYNYKDSITDFSTLKSVFNTNDGYSKNVFPTVPAANGDGVVLNTKSRFFDEDIPFGLCIIKNFGDLLGVPMKNTEKIIRWHQRFMDDDFVDEDGNFIKESMHKTGAPLRYGITSPYTLLKSSFPKLFAVSRM
jgi:opine dehydrogenase